MRESRCVWTRVSVCACLRHSEPVVSVYVHVSVSPREATPSQTVGKGSQTWDLPRSRSQQDAPGPRARARCRRPERCQRQSCQCEEGDLLSQQGARRSP